MAEVFALFIGIAASLLSSVSAFLAYLLIRKAEDDMTVPLVFIGIISVFLFFSSVFYTLRTSIGVDVFLGVDTRTGIPMFLFFAVLAVNGVIWQLSERSEFSIE